MSDTYFNNTADIEFYNSQDIWWQRGLPIVLTITPTGITRDQFTGQADLLDIGGEINTERGFCYIEGTIEVPTIDDSLVYEDGSFNIGAFSYLVDELTESSYRVRAYSINSAGVGYGNVITVTLEAVRIIPRDEVIGQKIVKAIADRIISGVYKTKVVEVMMGARVREVTHPQLIRQVVGKPVYFQKEETMLEFSEKQNWEEYFVSFNFARMVTPDTTIESAVVIAYDEEGTDVTETFTDPDELNISGFKVNVWVRGGTEQTYKLTCRITTSNGEKFEMDASITVTEI